MSSFNLCVNNFSCLKIRLITFYVTDVSGEKLCWGATSQGISSVLGNTVHNSSVLFWSELFSLLTCVKILSWAGCLYKPICCAVIFGEVISFHYASLINWNICNVLFICQGRSISKSSYRSILVNQSLDFPERVMQILHVIYSSFGT